MHEPGSNVVPIGGRPRHEPARSRQSLDFGWRFLLGDVAGAEDPRWDDSDWRSVDLPHDWGIEGEYAEANPSGRFGGYLPTGIGWYRRDLVVPKGFLNDRIAAAEFDGVYMNGDVWVNGVHLGHRPYGYIGFEYDLTPNLHEGRNVLAVRVDNSRVPSGRWYSGSGIYRHVWLTVTSQVHVAHWGTSVATPSVTDECAEVAATVTVRNDSPAQRSLWVRSDIRDQAGAVVAEAQCEVTVGTGTSTDVDQRSVIDQSHLWSPQSPYLYSMRTTVEDDGVVLDEYVTPFGVRTPSFDPDKGFWLNGEPVKLQGVCLHHDAGPVGAAVPDKVLERRLRLLKEMGCNAIRTAHSPAAPEFYDMCDRLGLLVVDEAFDGWDVAKAQCDYGLYFDQWWRRDLGDMIRRDRNHPSVIMWSIGNEVLEKTDERTRELVDFVHQLEPTRPVTCGRGISGVEDVQGFNGPGGEPGVLESYHAEHPDRVIVLTEEPHTLQTRGFYRTQTWWMGGIGGRPRVEVPNLTDEEIFFDGSLHYNSSYDNSGIRRCARDSWRRTRDLPYICGEFRWSGFDYLGESPGWPARMHNLGILDTCGFPKDHYFFYQSQWTPEPMVHLLPHWTHPGLAGVQIPVWAYSNCDEVELFLNGESLGSQRAGDQLSFAWLVPYSPGLLRAVGRRDGVDVATTEMATAGTATTLRLEVDNTDLKPDGRDVAHVSASVVDDAGTLVPRADNTVFFWQRGPVRCLGFDNGDPLDLTPHQANHRKVFHGLALGIFGSTSEPGDIQVVAGAILGETVFAERTQVTVSLAGVMLRGHHGRDRCSIYLTVDGSAPGSASDRYDRPFVVDATCTVRAAVYLDGERILTMEQAFIKGERPKVVDTTHGNRRPADLEAPTGPFAVEAVGTWQREGGLATLVLRLDGAVLRPGVDGSATEVGCWWYEFPYDLFDVPNDSGSGEIWWDDGSRTTIRLDTQQARHMYLAVGDRQLRFSRVGPSGQR